MKLKEIIQRAGELATTHEFQLPSPQRGREAGEVRGIPVS